MDLFGWLGAKITPADVRAEVWKLGVRHHGEPLQGALEELADRDLSSSRGALLRACVRSLRRAAA